jgi:hypothetical protein
MDDVDIMTLSAEQLARHARDMFYQINHLNDTMSVCGTLSSGQKLLELEKKCDNVSDFLYRVVQVWPACGFDETETEIIRSFVYQKFPVIRQSLFVRNALLVERVRAAKCPECYLTPAVFTLELRRGTGLPFPLHHHKWPLVRDRQMCVDGWERFSCMTGITSELDVPQETADVLVALTSLNKRMPVPLTQRTVRHYFVSLDALDFHKNARARVNGVYKKFASNDTIWPS